MKYFRPHKPKRVSSGSAKKKDVKANALPSMWYCIIAGAVTLNIHIKAAPSIKLDKQQ